MKFKKFLFSPGFMGILFLLFAVAMAVATFIENDFGSTSAYSLVYDTLWFEMILLLLAVNLVGQMISLKLYRRDKLPVFLFHFSFVILIIGAGITRYFGWEGTIHIREGEEQNACYSSDKYIGYSVKDLSGTLLADHSEKYSMNSKSAGNFKKIIKTGGKEYELILARILPNAIESVVESPTGVPVISILVTKDRMSRETLILKKGDSKNLFGISIGFESQNETDVTITADLTDFYIKSKLELGEMSMMSGEIKTLETGSQTKLKQMQIITLGDIKIVPQQMTYSGIMKPVAVDPAQQNTGQNAFVFHVFRGKESGTVFLWDKESENHTAGSCSVDGMTFEITYGSRITYLPFSLKLNDFVLERYPGSTSPSGYKSDVVLSDKSENIEKPFMIFMNNILKYKGFRFYQSSFDQDEKGTILSVNHDPAGMIVTYSGYGILILFIIISLIIKRSVFRNVNAGYWSSSIRKIVPFIFILWLLTGFNYASAQKLIPDRLVSEEFGKVLVQDQKGRTKPLYTLSNDILRKVTRQNEFDGLSSMQVFLGFYLDFDKWKDVPLIRVSNNELQQSIGIRGNKASFSDLVDIAGNGNYKLSEKVNSAYAKAPGERSKMDKEIMKVDERVNILYMIYTGDFLKLFPLKDGTHNWGSAEEALKTAVSKEDSVYLKDIITLFAEAVHSGNLATVRQISGSVGDYQSRFAKYDLPSESKTGAELLYYKLKIFERLFPFYATTGLIMLIGLIFMVMRGIKERLFFIKVLAWLLFAGFIFHTFGLGLRWYIAGHSPMSNGYESMIFISWVTLLAGFIFSRKSAFALSATAVLASMTLMVAHLSFMDPEITNLVPVLKSYWLTLHVSVITGSYGFLGLGAILGLITMILLALSDSKNRERISQTIDELTVINYKTLTLGLYFLTIGTFLGAVWANESWGRYWGWDPKETWSLITIVIYSLVIHSRTIPGMKDIYTFNFLSLFAFSSVLMTYFGVNYYLSGLHSYAAGDPVPVPTFVYLTVIVLAALSLLAYLKYNFRKKEGE
jgi:cytochrome c-type biogenesis protein CcsB